MSCPPRVAGTPLPSHWKNRSNKAARRYPCVYCLRTTLIDLDDATLWRTYTMLTNLELVFCSLKTDLGLRP
jgi:hypothetical protein